MFTVIHTNKTFDLNVENNMNVGELYDMVRAKVNNPFDLIYFLTLLNFSIEILDLLTFFNVVSSNDS